jgi:hypothetical protein
VKLCDFGLSYDMTGESSAECKGGDIWKTADAFCFILTNKFYGCEVEEIADLTMMNIVREMYERNVTIEKVLLDLRV